MEFWAIAEAINPTIKETINSNGRFFSDEEQEILDNLLKKNKGIVDGK